MSLLQHVITELSNERTLDYVKKGVEDLRKKSLSMPFNNKKFDKRMKYVRKAQVKLEEESPLFGRNLKIAAQDWIESHHDVLASVAHLIDDGDEKAVEKYLERYILDHNLFIHVMDTLFRGYAFKKLS